MAVHPPKVHVDEKLARGLTMSEVRAVLKAGRRIGSLGDETHPVRVAYKPVAFRYQTGRMPDQAFVDQLVERFDAFYGAAAGTVHRESDTPVDRRGGVGQTRRYVTLTPSTDDPGCRSLLVSCTCLDVRSICATIMQSPLLEVELHAIERFHQRTRQGLVREALATFASNLLKDVGLYKTMADFSIKLSTRGFAMPFADGLLMGHACEPHPAAVPPFVNLQFFAGHTSRYDRFLLGTDATCRVATFLGPNQMSDDQHELRRGILAIAERRSEYLRDLSNALTAAPLFFDKIAKLKDRNMDRFDHEGMGLERDMRELLAKPGMTRALGGGRTEAVVRPRMQPRVPEPEEAEEETPAMRP